LKKCSRCGTDLFTGQLVCPHCGKRQRRPRRVRCRTCGTISSQGLEICPGCGEPLRQDWLRPIGIAVTAVIGLVLVGLVGSWTWQALNRFQPSVAVSTVQAVASEVPVLVEVPTLTPSLTPSITPTPSETPTLTPTPSLTPTPTSTPAPTETPTPTLTATPTATPTRTQPTWTPTPAATSTFTPTPTPTIAPPTLEKPGDKDPFDGEEAIIPLTWQSSYSLRRDECYLVTVRWTENGAPVSNEVCTQEMVWNVEKWLYLRADQETDRLYYWSVRIVRKGTDASGQVTYIPLTSPSEERAFYWR
jgi:RNA polymerase subunit RPABC4/transcription elongation factor Spt4